MGNVETVNSKTARLFRAKLSVKIARPDKFLADKIDSA